MGNDYVNSRQPAQEERGKYKYYFLRQDNPGKHKRISERLVKSFEDLCQGKRAPLPAYTRPPE